MEIRFEEFAAIFRVCCYTNLILRSNMINLRSNFSQQYFSIVCKLYLKFDIRSSLILEFDIGFDMRFNLPPISRGYSLLGYTLDKTITIIYFSFFLFFHVFFHVKRGVKD